ncbi:unnamed protein product [Allacma fusca]|uniref:Uncharacterized protein n=1 Tax=Allacma fusca TaxID=39272 RepID=A0A8J2L1M9_9HEXA|nr:unnamed protein product [Allacma fusca]
MVFHQLQLPVNYMEKFRAECMDDQIMTMTLKDEDMKEELRSVVPVTGHRIAIINAFKSAINANQTFWYACCTNGNSFSS